MHLQITICDQKFGSNLQFAWNQKCNFTPKCLILHIKFPKFAGVIPLNPRCGMGDPLPQSLQQGHARGRKHPRSSSPQFDAPLSNAVIHEDILVLCTFILKRICKNVATRAVLFG